MANKIENKISALAHVATIAKLAGDNESATACADAMLTIIAMSDILSKCAKALGDEAWREIVNQSEKDAIDATEKALGDRSNVVPFPGPRTVN